MLAGIAKEVKKAEKEVKSKEEEDKPKSDKHSKLEEVAKDTPKGEEILKKAGLID